MCIKKKKVFVHMAATLIKFSQTAECAVSVLKSGTGQQKNGRFTHLSSRRRSTGVNPLVSCGRLCIASLLLISSTSARSWVSVRPSVRLFASSPPAPRHVDSTCRVSPIIAPFFVGALRTWRPLFFEGRRSAGSGTMSRRCDAYVRT